ncbi:MAG: pyridoxamine 5'-phosphate oxidase family protein [Dehalococcoidales bacterium]|nr:pyridoxamine 5'-phosphate oxidase family protein [Dehalococcoidales bacterium]
MDFKECIDFANANKTCYLATVDGDQPRVRAMGMHYADEMGFYFNTENTKSLAKQLENNQKVEVCFFAQGKMLRVSGKIEFIDDIAIRERFFKERPFLKDAGVKNPEDPFLMVFALRQGEAFIWTFADNLKEADIPRIKFG